MSAQTPGFSLALGLMVHGLSVSGHGKAEDIHPRLLAAWIKILLAEVPQLHPLSYCQVHSNFNLYSIHIKSSSKQNKNLSKV